MRISVPWKKSFLIIALCSAFFLFFAPVGHAQEKSLVWEEFHVDIAVHTDGTFDVVEHQTIDFTSGSFTSGFREIPKRNYGYIDNWQLTDSSGTVYTQQPGGAPYTFTVEDNYDSYLVRWHFPSIRNASETYSLGYTVHEGLRFYEGGDQVWWKAIYGDRPFPVLDGQVRVSVPDAAEIQEWAAYINGGDARDSATAELNEENDTIVFDLTRRLNAGEEFEVRVQFTSGVVSGTVQPWQERADREAAALEEQIAFRNRWRPIAMLGFGALGLLFLLGGPAGLYAFWYRMGRDKPVELVADYLPEPPDELPPGMAGTLLDETVDMEDIIATLVDLARRKAISITEKTEESWFRSSTDYIYRRERNDVPLNEYEEALLEAVFGNNDQVRLSDLKEKFYKKLPGIKEKLYTAVTHEGYFTANPETVRSQYGCLGVAALAGAVAVGFVLLSAFGNLTGVAVFPAIGLGVTALGLLILSRHMPRKTNKGAEAAARWQAFKNYLRNIDQYSDLEAQKEIWDRWLPYAIAFGIEKEYIRKFEAVEAPAPGWYIPSPTMYGPYQRGYYGRPWVGPRTGTGTESGGPVFTGGGFGGMSERAGGGLGDMSRGMGGSLTAMSAGLGGMLTSASTAMASRPASSSSGGGWSGGGGGFSGGGGFGGGGGGGGGGGFR